MEDGSLRATFLGHQGWLLGSSTTHVLVDPLLTERFGHGGLAGRVFPPRSIDRRKLPPIDAIVLTHEHDDHFDIPTLLAVERSVPIYVSGRSSPALSGFLRAQGFEVRPMSPEDTVEIGALRYRCFVADHRSSPSADEWDVLPFVVTDARGRGAFASSVDVAMPPAMIETLATTPGWPGLLCLANNTTDTRFVRRDAGRLEPTDDTDVLARVLGRRWQALAERAGAPRMTAITGGGWSHPADVAWLDALAFSIDPQRLARALQSQCGAPVVVARPGRGVRLGARALEAIRSEAIVAGDPARPPASAVCVPDRFAPVLPAQALHERAWSRLEAGLRTLARHWFGRAAFVHAMSAATASSIAFAVHGPALPWDAPRVYAYAPWAGAFVRSAATDPYTTFSSGFECWAGDLLALFEGRIGPSALCYTGRVRCWNRSPDQLRVSPHDLWSFAHPMRCPELALALYEHVAGELGPVSIDIRGARDA